MQYITTTINYVSVAYLAVNFGKKKKQFSTSHLKFTINN